MTVCEVCEELCDGLGPYCRECQHEIDEYEGEDCEGEP
jgi:hypothetical protein